MAKISGFSIVRNGVKFDYPFIESILSLLPLVDEMIVAVGKSDDNTLEKVKGLDSSKVKVMETVWDDENRKGGAEFARQTNIALKECRFPWALYLQADEVLHQDDIPLIKSAIEKHGSNSRVDALSFRYIHFEANYDYYNPFRYRRQVRVVRTDSDIISIKDAAEFGHSNGKKLKIKKSGAVIYHYGWVKSPKVMLEKSREFEKYWHDDEYVENKYDGLGEFDFKMLNVSKRFRGSHPEVMSERVKNWNIRLPRQVPRRPLVLRKDTWRILVRKWGLVKKEWF